MSANEHETAVETEEISDADNRIAIKALILLLITFILGTLCLQGFNLVFEQVGKAVGSPAQASLITALPSIVLGIVCFLYGSLGDFVSLKKLVATGLVIVFIGSIFGFVANFFFQANLWTVIIARVLQTAGEQVAGSAYLVITTKYLRSSLKVIFFGIYTAGYQLSSAIGVFAGGLLSSIHWQFLFLIPAVTILFVPALMKYLPAMHSTGKGVDWLGFTIFGAACAFVTLFFSYMDWWMLAVSVLLFCLFAVYIHRNSDNDKSPNAAQAAAAQGSTKTESAGESEVKSAATFDKSAAKPVNPVKPVAKSAKSRPSFWPAEPFVTPAFFHNTRWLKAIMLILLFYFTNYSAAPILNAIGSGVYGMQTIQVSHYIVWAYVVAAIVGTSSGAIVDRIGHTVAIIAAAILMICGFVGASLLVNAGFIWLTLMACIFYAGMGLLYSPVVDTVLGTLPKEQSGRGVGMNDLVMAITASIGIAIFGGIMNSQSFAGFSLTGAHGVAANCANILLLGAGIIAIGLIVFLLIRKDVYHPAEAEAEAKAKA
ncbi:MFS transporter [Bifidobacterium sp. ESL0728]|uniref:MFS transporter n=1 Tax=Bifidobacterium sp. ESL0728 TaxID=2983220 RepID=UPI0023F6F555|nr:MFS transporter [Bifidobacterium sp. ESL0728]WEV59222.1 MFS transporter [Bifidobacterium sp. ESL0728]